MSMQIDWDEWERVRKLHQRDPQAYWRDMEEKVYEEHARRRAEEAEAPRRPTVVCLCGSTRFSEAFREANLRETLAGNIVLTIGCDMRSDAEVFAHMTEAEVQAVKERLDTLHLRKIDLADEVLILNVGGYIGASTTRELAYADAHGKRVRFLEPLPAQEVGNG